MIRIISTMRWHYDMQGVPLHTWVWIALRHDPHLRRGFIRRGKWHDEEGRLRDTWEPYAWTYATEALKPKEKWSEI